MISLEKLNADLQGILNRVNIDTVQSTADNAKTTRVAIEGSKIGVTINETAGGFQSLTATTEEGETVTIEPTVALMTNSIDGGGIKVTRTSGNISEITTLTGKTTSNGFLSTVVTHGSPKGIESAIRASVSTDENAIKLKVRETSSDPQVAEQNVGIDISKSVITDLQKISKRLNIQTANPYGSTTGSFGSIGLPFGNVLGNVVATISGALRKSSFINDNTRSLGRVVFPESFDPNTPEIIGSNGKTSITPLIGDGNEFELFNSPVKVGKSLPGWRGNSTSPNSFKTLFSHVDSKEELDAEMRGSFINRPFTAMLVGSTKTARNQDVDAEYIHRKHVEYVNRNMVSGQRNKYGGIQAHYVIRRDGSIQRGRPLVIPYWTGEGIRGWAKRTIVVYFAGGVDLDYPYEEDKEDYLSPDSYTSAQWIAFESLCQSFRAASPGGEVISIDEYAGLGNVKESAMFSALDWTNQRFGWETLYVGNNSLTNRWQRGLGPMNLDEVSKYLPNRIAKPSVTPVNTKPATVSSTVTKTDEEKESDEQSLFIKQADIDKFNRELLRLRNEYDTLLGNPDFNASRINQILSRISVLNLNVSQLESFAEQLRVNRHDSVSYRKTLLDQAESVNLIENTAESQIAYEIALDNYQRALTAQAKTNSR